MNRITARQRQVIRSVALVTALVAGGMFGLGLMNRIELPLIIPLLLLAAAAGLLLATRAR